MLRFGRRRVERSASEKKSGADGESTSPNKDEDERPKFILRDGLLVDSSRRLQTRKDEEDDEEMEVADIEQNEDEKATESSTSDMTSPLDFSICWTQEDLEAVEAYVETAGECENEDGTVAPPGATGRCTRSSYGRSSSVETEEIAREIGRPLDGGLIWHSALVPDNYGEENGGPKPKDWDEKRNEIKARRGNLKVRQTDFFSSVVRIDDYKKWTEPNSMKSDEEGSNNHNSSSYDSDDGGEDFEIFEGEKLEIQFFPRIKRRSSDEMVPLITESGEDAYKGPRFVFFGILNGWPSMRCLEVTKIEFKTKIPPRWFTHWSARRHGRRGIAPTYPTGKDVAATATISEVRAVLRAPHWTAHGWSEESQGYAFWFEALRGDNLAYQPNADERKPRLLYGMNMFRQFEADAKNGEHVPLCETVHMVSHRYSVGAKHESTRDRLTYHSIVLLEWDHGNYCTVIETAYLNGMGGYAGRTNWYDDKLEEVPSLYKALPPEMIAPWKNNLSEIRCFDVPAKSLNEFKQYISRHQGHSGRFVDPHFNFSHKVRLTFRSKAHIAHYLLNYIRRDRTYSEVRRNCQTFAADLCGFLAGKKDVQPFHPVSQIGYKHQKHQFLYESTLYY